MADFNPYAPPQAVSDVARAPVQLPRGRALKWIYGGLAGVTFFVLVLTHLVAYSDETQVLWDAVGVIDKPIALVRIVLALMWIHGAWSDVPRQLRAELDVTPGGAVGRLFIPAFNLYWMFALNQKRRRATSGRAVRAGDARPRAAHRARDLLEGVRGAAGAVLVRRLEPVVVRLHVRERRRAREDARGPVRVGRRRRAQALRET